MYAAQVCEVLKNMSEDELVSAGGAVACDRSLEPEERQVALALINREQAARGTEGIGRKLERFWNRHGHTVGAIALGALIGDWYGD
jgi:hypothetical protein